MEENITVQEPAPETRPPQKQKEKLYSALAYISILWLVGLLASPERHNKNVRFHVGQGLALFIFKWIAIFVLGIGGGLLGMLISLLTGVSFEGGLQIGSDSFLFSPIFAVILSLVILVAVIILLVLTLSGLINGVKGRNKPLRMVGRFAFYN